MIDHISSYTTRFEHARGFYDATLGALGYQRNVNMVASWDTEFPTRRICAYGEGQKPTFWLVEDREASSPRHIAFAARDHAAVRAFHAAALGAGAQDFGAPGPRPVYHPHYYGAFALDPDDNNVEACCHRPEGG